MDINDVILPNMVATEMRDFLQEHLLHWQGMSQECTARSVRIGVKCHEATMLTRIYQRLMMLLSQRWEDTRKHARHAGQS